MARKAVGKGAKLQTPGIKAIHPCDIMFDSPMDNMLEVMHELATRVSLIAAKESNTTQLVWYSEEVTTTQWLPATQLSSAAFPLAICAIVVSLSTMVHMWWGWWRLKEHQEMTPEIMARLYGREAAEAEQEIPLHSLQQVEPERPIEVHKEEEGEAETRESRARLWPDRPPH